MVSLFVAFCAGIFGTLIGALNSFIIFGLVLIFGVVTHIMGVVTGTTPFDWIGLVAFGPYFAPYITFLGGAVAAMYASKKGYIESGKALDIPLINIGKVDVYLVGGLFGALGYLFSTYIVTPYFGTMVDGGALTIVVVSLLAKWYFEGSVFGKITKEDQRLGGRFSSKLTNVWQPAQRCMVNKVFLGISVGSVAAFCTFQMYQSGVHSYVAAYFGFAIATFSLIYLNLGIPVTHHIALCSGYAVVAVLMCDPTITLEACMVWGCAFGVVATYLGDVLASVFYVYGDQHIDPPGLAIIVGSVTAMVGIEKLNLVSFGILIPAFILIVFITLAMTSGLKTMKAQKKIKVRVS